MSIETELREALSARADEVPAVRTYERVTSAIAASVDAAGGQLWEAWLPWPLWRGRSAGRGGRPHRASSPTEPAPAVAAGLRVGLGHPCDVADSRRPARGRRAARHGR